MTYPLSRLGVRMRAVLTTFDETADPSTWTWTDITSHVHHMTGIVDDTGGPDDTSDSNTALAFTIINDDGAATTDNPSSIWYPYWDVGTPVDYAIDVGDGGGWDIQVIAFLDTVTLTWPSGTKYRCLAHVTCVGRLTRENDTQKPGAASAVRRSILTRKQKAFHALEDPSGTLAAASALTGGSPLVSHGGAPVFTFGSQPLVPGVASMATIAVGQSMIAYFTPTTAQSVKFTCLFAATQAPAGTSTLFSLFNGPALGNRYVVQMNPSGLQLRVYNNSTTEISGAATVGFAAHTQGCVWFELLLTQNGANVDWSMIETLWFVDPNTGLAAGQGGGAGGSFAGTLGPIYAYTIAEFADVSSVTIGMTALMEPPYPAGGGFAAVLGWAGQTAASRVVGIASDFRVPSSVVDVNAGALMGPELIGSLLANLRDVQHTDHGVLTDHLGTAKYRALSELYNLAPAISLSRTVRGQLSKDIGAVRDTTAKANRVTLQRSGGSSVMIENANDIALRGTFERSPDSVNYATDYQLASGAGWYLARGTATGQRHSGFELNMVVAAAYTPTLAGQVASLQLGDRIIITSPPDQLAPNPIERQVRGRHQTVLNRGQAWRVAYDVVPVDAYQAFVLDETMLDTSGTELVAAATTTATTLVTATAGALPAVGGGLSIPLWAEGEKINLTTVTAEAAADPFTRGAAGSTWGSFPATVNLAAMAYGLTGTAADFALTGTTGTISVPTAAASRAATLPGLVMLDVDMISYCSVPSLATGAPLEVEPGWRRRASDGSCYSVRLQMMPTNAILVSVYAPLNGTPIVDQLDVGLTHTAGATYGIRVQTIGTRHMVYVWQGTTTALMPPNPQIDIIDTTRYVPGYCSWRNGRSSGNTNAGAVVFTWDNISFQHLQAFTVTRSLNAVVKALPVNGRMRLWDGRGFGV